MKKLVLILFIVSIQSFFDQTENQKIQKDFESMIAYTRQSKIDEIIEMTYPRLISIYGKDGTKGLLSLSFGGLGIKTIYEENPINLKISTITKLKDGDICM